MLTPGKFSGKTSVLLQLFFGYRQMTSGSNTISLGCISLGSKWLEDPEDFDLARVLAIPVAALVR